MKLITTKSGSSCVSDADWTTVFQQNVRKMAAQLSPACSGEMTTTVRVWTAVLAAGGGSLWSQSDRSNAPESIRSRPCIKDLHTRDQQPIRALHAVNQQESGVCWAAGSPGQFQQGVLTILLLGVGRLTVVFIEVGSHLGPVCVLVALRYLTGRQTDQIINYQINHHLFW